MPACQICGAICAGDTHWLGLTLCGRESCFATAWNRKHHPDHPSTDWTTHPATADKGEHAEEGRLLIPEPQPEAMPSEQEDK